MGALSFFLVKMSDALYIGLSVQYKKNLVPF